jgi:hypothetical protein
MPYAYYTHDSGYRHGGLWVAETLDAPWTWCVAKKKVDGRVAVQFERLVGEHGARRR